LWFTDLILEPILSPIQDELQQAHSAIERVDLLNRFAFKLCEQEHLTEAKIVARQAYDLAAVASENEQPYDRGLANSLVIQAKIDMEIIPYPQTLKRLLEALALLEQVEDPACLADALNLTSWVYFSSGDYPTAQSYIERAIQLAEKTEDWKNLASALNTAGSILCEMKDFDQAIQILHRSIGISEQWQNPKDQGLAYNNLAMVLLSRANYAEAEAAGLTSLSLIQPINLPFAEACVLDTIGLAVEGLKKLDDAAIFFKKALQRVKVLDNPLMELEPCLHLGQVLLKTGDLQAAEKNLLLALDIAREHEASRIRYLCHEQLATLFERRGDFQTALAHFRQFHTMKDKIYNLDNIQQVANLTAVHKLETAMKDAEILRLKNSFLVQEIELEKRRHAELEHFATTDSLTGLFNRRHFLTLATFEFSKARTEETGLGMIMIDIDHFKAVNDQHGHPIGDQVLIQVAATLNSHIRQQDLCCRYGGEEFLFLLPGSTPEGSLVIADRLRLAVETLRVMVGSLAVQVTVSVGVACMQSADLTLENLIEQADKALFKAKSNGRNSTVLIE
jgi:diguanylate cyclase (GGDEF)-like protein